MLKLLIVNILDREEKIMAKWVKCTIGDLCDTISDTYKGNDENVILVNTSDVLEGKVLNHTLVPNKNLKGQFKKTFRKMIFFFRKFVRLIRDLLLLILRTHQIILHLQS